MKKNNSITTLIDAAQEGNEGAVIQLLQAGFDVNQAAMDGVTALIKAASNGELAILDKLLQAGADVNHASNIGMTALMYAAERGHVEIVRELLKWADVSQIDRNGDTALTWAIRSQSQDEIKIRIIGELLEAGANIDQINFNGDTALTMAASRGNQSVVKKLLEAGASTNSLVGNMEGIPANCKGLIKIADVVRKKVIEQELSDEEAALLNAYSHNFIKKLLVGQLQQMFWREAFYENLPNEEFEFLERNRDVHKVIRTKYLETKANLITKKAKQITEKVLRNQSLNDQETRFLDSSEFNEYDATLLNLFHNTVDLTSRALSDELSKDMMEYMITFLSKKEVFALQSGLINTGMRELLKNNYKIQVEGKERSLSLEEMNIDGFESNKIIQLYHEILRHKDEVISFRSTDIINLSELLKKYKMIDNASGVEESKESADTAQQHGGVEESKESADIAQQHGSQDKEDNIQTDSNSESEQFRKFFAAIDQNDFNQIQELVLMNPLLVNAINDDGNSAFFMASMFGHDQVAQYLLTQGVYVPEYGLNEEEFDLDLLSLNLLNFGNLDQEAEEAQFQWNFMNDNNSLYTPLLGLGLLIWLIS